MRRRSNSEASMEQLLALLLASPDLAGERHSEWDLRQLEQHHGGDHREEEGPKQAITAGGDRAKPLVELEQHGRAVRCPETEVHLEQLVVLPLEPILGTREVGHLRIDATGTQRVELGRTERISGADQLRLVRVDDAARAVPDLHAHDWVCEQPRPNRRVDCPDRLRLSGQQLRGYVRRGDAPARELG